MVVYGGDEVTGVVLDIGCGSSRVGFSGEEAPSHVFPSVVGVPASGQGNNVLGETSLYHWRPELDIKSPFGEDGIQDWDLLESLWDYSYNSCLRTPSAEHPLLYTEPAWNPKETREKLVELAFEKYQVPGFFLAKSPVLSAFAAGKSTALVIDIGAKNTSVVPVHDGYVLKKAVQHQAVGGDFISEQIVASFQKQNLPIVPQYLVSSKQSVDSSAPPAFTEYPGRRDRTTESFHNFGLKRVADDFKETICLVSESAYNPNALGRKAVKNYEFPNGYNNAYRMDRYRMSEVLFDPRYVIKTDDASMMDQDGPDLSNTTNLPFLPITHLVRQALNGVDIDVRSSLLSNIIVTGGSSLMPGLVERLHSELYTVIPGSKIKISAPGSTTERKYSAWIGGSILSSLGTFHQLWVSKQQYKEMGTAVEKKMH